MGYEHLSTTLKTESDEIIKSSVKNLVQIPSECEVTSDNESECDVPVCEDSSTFDVLKDHSEILLDSNNDDTSSDGDAFEDIEYVKASLLASELVSLEEDNDVYQEEKDDHTEETRSGSTTVHANNSLPEYDLFCFKIEPALMNNIDELNEDECFDSGGEIDVFANIKDDDYFPFIFFIRI
nr:hypothetical protein [Tanacetum cinerariifolium]GEZ93093.1 hypothetical protein [Tanacetum cinerariifolium]